MTVDSLSTDQQIKYYNFINDSSVSWFALVNLEELATFQQNGLLTLGHPEKECSVIFKAKWVEEFNEGSSFYWYGEVPESPCDSTQICDCEEGVMNIVYDSLGYNINLTIDQDLYRIEPIGGAIHIIMKYEDPISNVSFCGNDHVDSLGSNYENQTPVHENFDASLRNETHCPVRVLFLFTQLAHAEMGGIGNLQKYAHEGIHYTNQAYRNSRVFNLNLEYAGIQHLDWVAPNKSSDAIKELKDLMAPDSLIWGFRQQYNADIVIVFLTKSYGEKSGEALDVIPDTDLALAFVNVFNSDSHKIPLLVAHETGHLFGCRHHDNQNNPDPIFPRAYRYWTPGFIWDKKRLTVVHEGSTFSRYIQHYSNPAVNKHGAPTGAETRNNALQLRNQACFVANYLPAPPQYLNLHISGNKLGCPCDYLTLEANYNVVENGTYLYEWRTSTDGFNWSPILSISSFINIGLPCQENEGLFVQLTLILPNGTSVKRAIYVQAVSDPHPNFPCARISNTVHLAPDPNESFKVFPNPTKDYLNVEFTTNLDQIELEMIEIKIINAIGQIQYNNTISTSQLFSIPITNWPSGAYWIHVNNFTPKMFIIEK